MHIERKEVRPNQLDSTCNLFKRFAGRLGGGIEMHKHTFVVKLLLLAAIGLIAVGCAGVPTAAPAGTSAPSGNAPQVTIWIGEGPEGQAMVAAADAYNKKFNANIVVQL